MKFSTIFSNALAAATAALALCLSAAVSAQTGPTLLQEQTSADGLLTLSLWSANGSDAVGVNNTYMWIATNNSTTFSLTGVVLGSHWGDRCAVTTCVSASPGPVGPTLISVGPGCGSQSPSEFDTGIARFGIWCTPSTGVTLQPGQSISGSVTFRPLGAGIPNYTVYSGYNSPTTGKFISNTPSLTQKDIVAAAATDIQITGSASSGSPAIGSTFTYNYQIRNAGPWGTGGGLTFVDTLPASLTFVGSSLTVAGLAGANVCSAVGQTVSCRIFDIDNSGPLNQLTIALNVVASSTPQQVVNTATVFTTLPQTDSNTTNNSVTVTVTTR